MNLKQAFIAAFYFLNLYYEETNNEAFLDIVSGMNPFVWEDESSADPAAERDWEAIANSITIEAYLSPQQAFQIMYEYVKFFKTEFGFNFDWIMEGLLEKTHNDPKWMQCVSKSKEVCVG